MGQAKDSIRFPHLVDDTHIYIHVNSWGSALGASVLAKRYYPNHKLQLVSEERLQRLIEES